MRGSATSGNVQACPNVTQAVEQDVKPYIWLYIWKSFLWSTFLTGYGKAYSHLELTPTSSDEGTEYTCYVDIPAVEAYYTQRLSVSFCKYFYYWFISICLALYSSWSWIYKSCHLI